MFIFSLGLILITGFIAGFLLNKIKIPGLVGMIMVGLLIGPEVLNLIDDSLLNISSELRQIALVIILTRSGLNLDLESLKKVGRPAILMCFIPATFEIAGVALASYFFLSLNIFESLLLGTVLAAVSPAVVSPRMIKLIDEDYGKEHEVPKLILAGSSVDDIYCIVLFYAFLGLVENNTFDFVSVALVPLTIILGIILGLITGISLGFLFKKVKMPVVVNIILMLSISFLMIGLENAIKEYISISSLLGIMVMGMAILFITKDKAKEISNGYNNLWKVFEIILFVLVGATLSLTSLKDNWLMALLVMLIGLVFRCLGVYVCIIKTKLTFKERLFSIFAYLPKATVQASIGGIALSLGLSCGSTILTVSVLTIIVTAPLGAILIDNFHKKLLIKGNPEIDANAIE
ncbi:MAG: cation:proton antiporter [Acholeplasmatales bacterium]|nr:cation:proton antiporter [Acholeplasmatales bacterium]